MLYELYYVKDNPPQSSDGFTFDLQRFATDTWDGTASSVPAAVNNVITITTAEQLAALAKNVNDEDNSNPYSGQTIKLGADIDLGGHNWTPIGTSYNQFKGTFDGNSHTISNLTITGSSSDRGLFGYNNGTIQNVTLTNVDVSGDWNVGGVVGYNEGGTVENCTVSGTFTGNRNIGGVVGQNDKGTVKNCVTVSTINGSDNAGGLVGYNYNGTVTGNYYYSNKNVIHYNTGSASNNKSLYVVTLPDGVTVTSGAFVTANGTTYAAGNITLAGKTGYTYSGTTTANITAAIDLSNLGTATFDTSNHYVLANNTSTLATTTNTTDYPDLIQVYALTVPTGVTVSGSLLTDGNTAYVTTGNITLAAKLGYVYSGTTSAEITADTDLSTFGNATFDTANHYVFGNATDGYTLATADNIAAAGYPELIQVYALTVPTGVTVSGSLLTDGNTAYVTTGNVTLSAAEGYTLQNVKVNGESLDDNTFTVSADATVLADSLKFNKAGTAVEVGGTTGNLSTFNGVYSITASQENSTLTGNNNNNNVVIAGGGENILTGGGGNDTYQFSKGGGIVTDFGIGATKNKDGSTLKNPLGTDVIKVDGEVKGVYFDRAASSKKTPTFTAIVTYDSTAVTGDDTQIIVLQNINKKPTKYSSDASKVVYQTNDVAAATLKIWDTSGSKQAVLSASKLKALFRDDDQLTDDLKTQIASLGKLDGIGDLNLPAIDALNQNTQATFNGDDNG